VKQNEKQRKTIIIIESLYQSRWNYITKVIIQHKMSRINLIFEWNWLSFPLLPKRYRFNFSFIYLHNFLMLQLLIKFIILLKYMLC